ncbi:pentapeptide repeat-containing protein [Azospirillum sp.]|uniref:pentapeptide repeat-containing protein n=1 Tax=Azospirillum sp. TaxID=34012 RepID=UPI00262B94E3|nr:pentapeptide repeat-containing protein [Azospirillum sp.]
MVLVLELLLLGGKTGAALTSFDAIADHDKKVEAFGKLISAIGLLAAAPVGVAGVALAFWRSWNQHRDGLTAIRKLDAETYAKAAEAFAKAVEQLGSDKSSIRMGAVLALEALGKSTPRLLSQTIEILCAYVREPRPVSPTPPTDETGKTAPVPPLPTDIQLILDIVNRLKGEDTDNRIRVDLSSADIRRADLRNANLFNADLSGADLTKASLFEVNLRNANLFNAKLTGARLFYAKLTEASLSWADLSWADLLLADLSRADLGGANLTNADLSGANLTNADLSRANLTDANLTDTIFKDTILPDGSIWTGKGPPPDPAPTPVTNA